MGKGARKNRDRRIHLIDAVAGHAATCGLTLDQALEMSWEALEVMTNAHRRRRAEEMLMWMVGCQGNEGCWKEQIKSLGKELEKGL